MAALQLSSTPVINCYQSVHTIIILRYVRLNIKAKILLLYQSIRFFILVSLRVYLLHFLPCFINCCCGRELRVRDLCAFI